jgi:molybdopterin-containing oxidoreductase family iron-sulfur binding subunit
MKDMHNPDVSVRPVGVIEKCTFCHHRLIIAREQVKADGREFEESDYVPACVQTCPTGAIVFGDLDNPKSRVSELTNNSRAFQLMGELGTKPKVSYLKAIER